MPLFPPVTDTLRWADLVQQGRSQLPLVAPEWTDQNPSDPGIALLELLAWLVEVDSYRSSAVTDRERRRLLALCGFSPSGPTAARALARITSTAPLVPAGLVATGTRAGDAVPLTLADDVVVRGARVAAVAWAAQDAEPEDLTRELGSGRPVLPVGADPAPGDSLLVGLDVALTPGPVDLWVVAAPGLGEPESPGPGTRHHSARTRWEVWDGSAWSVIAETDTDDATAALTRSGRVRLTVPEVPLATLGDQTLAWLRCRLVSGRHDAPPTVSAVHVDVGEVVATAPYDGGVLGGVLGAVIGVATGVPGETLELPEPWCGAPPRLWAEQPDGTTVDLTAVPDLALAGPGDRAVLLDPDGVTVHLGDGRCGATLPAGSTVRAAGTWSTTAGVGDLRPPLAVTVPGDPTVRLELVSGLEPGSPAEDVAATAARAAETLWVHDRITEVARRHRVTSLDDLPLELVRRLPVPERAVTALDVERRVLATAGTSLWRARALPEVDPRLPGLVADGCLTVAVVPWLPVDRPVPTPALLARLRAELEATRTLGTRVFVVGPDYVRVGVRAILRLLPGARAEDVVARGRTAVDTFLHPVTGGPSGRGWPFGRAVRRSELLQLLDQVPGVDRVEQLELRREPHGDAVCGDLALCATQLVLAGDVDLQADGSGR